MHLFLVTNLVLAHLLLRSTPKVEQPMRLWNRIQFPTNFNPNLSLPFGTQNS